MKNLLIILFVSAFTHFSFGQKVQELVGTWLKEPYQKKGLKLTQNGGFILFQVGKEENISDRDKFLYKTVAEGGVNYLLVYVLKGETEIVLMKYKYKLEKNKLFLPITYTENGITKVKEFADVYSKK